MAKKPKPPESPPADEEGEENLEELSSEQLIELIAKEREEYNALVDEHDKLAKKLDEAGSKGASPQKGVQSTLVTAIKRVKQRMEVAGGVAVPARYLDELLKVVEEEL